MWSPDRRGRSAEAVSESPLPQGEGEGCVRRQSDPCVTKAVMHAKALSNITEHSECQYTSETGSACPPSSPTTQESHHKSGYVEVPSHVRGEHFDSLSTGLSNHESTDSQREIEEDE